MQPHDMAVLSQIYSLSLSWLTGCFWSSHFKQRHYTLLWSVAKNDKCVNIYKEIPYTEICVFHLLIHSMLWWQEKLSSKCEYTTTTYSASFNNQIPDKLVWQDIWYFKVLNFSPTWSGWVNEEHKSQYKEFPGITQFLELNAVYLFPPGFKSLIWQSS